MIAIIDYGIGNLRSVQKALQKAGGDARLVSTPSELESAKKIVLPGVAAFGDAVEQLGQMGLIEPLTMAIKSGVPYLGFCLGLQLLFDVSHEDGMHLGLGIFPGKVTRFQFDPSISADRLAVPHMGWNQLHMTPQKTCPMFNGIENGDYVYFAHSYHVVPADQTIVAATTDYGYPFVSAVWRDNIFATQFHPEKSQAVGLKLLENFVKL